MRRCLIGLMTASMLIPAAASAQDHDSTRGNRERLERSERSDSGDRPQRAERQGRSERGDGPARTQRIERSERTDRAPRLERRMERGEPAQVEQVQRIRRIERNDDSLLDGLRSAARRQQDGEATETRRRDRDASTSWRERIVESGGRADGEASTDWSRRVIENGSRADRDRDGRRDWRRDGRRDRNWSRDWRHDHRYDWHGYRNRYGSLFRLGRYYDPYGWNYRRFSIGFNLWPSYYGSRFWLNDPWHYRLPPAYGPYRWVRYYDDALLVNIYTGQVVDVIYNVFW